MRFQFRCKDDHGAFLLLDPAGISESMTERELVSRHMSKHFARWVQFANDRLGLGLREEQLVLVHGTTKARRWGMAAFSGDQLVDKTGSVSAVVNSRTSAGFSFSIEDADFESLYWQAGPRRRIHDETAANSTTTHAASDSDDGSGDQCLFLHYYKMKRRATDHSIEDSNWYDDFIVVGDSDDFGQDAVHTVRSVLYATSSTVTE